MDTVLIDHFRAVAQNLSFTKAAEVLGTTQPQISRSIRRLEDVLGHELFDRTNRQISLTAAGEVFLTESQAIVDRVSLAVRKTALAAGGASALRVGYTRTVPDQPFSRGIRQFRHAMPGIELDLISMKAQQQADALRSGALDVGLMQVTNCSLHDLSWRTVGRTRFVVAIPADWPIPHDKPLQLGALRNYPFVLSDPKFTPDIHAAQLALCQKAGFAPIVARYGWERSELMFLVASGFGACFIFEPALRLKTEGVKLIPMAEARQEVLIDFVAAWPKEHEKFTVRQLVDLVTAEAREGIIVNCRGEFDLEWQPSAFG